MSGAVIQAITPEPTDAERAAIAAALETLQSDLWPPGAYTPPPSPRWRYAGRPWMRRSCYGGWA